MNALLLIPSKYELELCPSVKRYERYNEFLYRFFFSGEISVLVGITGIGKLNVAKFFDELDAKAKSQVDMFFSIGTCGLTGNIQNVNIGDSYVSNEITYEKLTYKIDLKIINEFLLSKRNVHIGKSLTTDNYLTEIDNASPSFFSVDMEGFHIYQYCQLIKKWFLNIRIISDFCNPSEHINQISIKEHLVKRYKLLIFETIKFLKEIQL